MARKVENLWGLSRDQVSLRPKQPLVTGMETGRVERDNWQTICTDYHSPRGRVVSGGERTQQGERLPLHSGAPSLRMETHPLPSFPTQAEEEIEVLREHLGRTRAQRKLSGLHMRSVGISADVKPGGCSGQDAQGVSQGGG